ncbi:HlyD family secretion protein [Mycolicibacterium sp. P1-5]|uniref:HlyD family efflux transporter periplasmic adaptor subunit n=1 Tax=Mycolicibacterium sp. P1-5 TaxID=2024617 RepID=UPI0011ED5831|nr:HlyD family secretion protein [Mycolicibacterium sp. P1-5]KAA0103709.1 HlyD family secretion protein [Mycolicibacterium sp. P1-5]
MTTARAINLRVRPLQSVDLAFPIDGIIGAQSDVHLLGKQVKAFDLNEVYGVLGDVIVPAFKVQKYSKGHFGAVVETDTAAGPQPLGWGRLKYDSAAIHQLLQPYVLFELRAEHLKAAVDKGVAQRENVWIQKFENGVYQATLKAYARDEPTAKLGRLQALAGLSQGQHDRLHDHYMADNYSETNNMVNDVVKGSVTSTGQIVGTTQTWVPTTRTSGQEYRAPSFENDAQLHRAQISLIDERLAALAATNYACGSSELDGKSWGGGGLQYFKNDLRSIDLDVKRLQLAYIDTLLTSPIDGVVTGVFRNLGDSVRTAQAVVRVENDAEVLLVGTLKYPGLLRIGQDVTIGTRLFDSTQQLTVTGKVVAVRGHDSEDQLWDVLIACANRDADGVAKFPINYNFDFDGTTVTVG